MRPDVFAAVMATGIVSIAAADHRVELVSVLLAVIAVVALPALVYGTALAWKRDSWSLRDLDTTIGLLTYVAACAVLAGRFATSELAVLVFGALALSAVGVALGLIPPSSIAPVAAGATAGAFAESVLGATLEHRGVLTNDALNFLNTAVAVWAAVLLARWW